jgi:tetratricopeptide (TPR) repeat protein
VSPGDAPARAAISEGAAFANPGSAAALYDLAAIRLRAGRFDEAAELARRAAAAEPARTLARELLADALEQAGDAGGAEDAIREAIEAGRADGDTHARHARLLALRGDLAGALGALERGLAADPWSFECCRRAAILRIAHGEAERALALLEGYLAGTDARRAEAIPVVPSVGPDAPPGAPPPATVASYPSELEYREELRRISGRRSHVLAANRYQARILIGDALRSLGRVADAQAAYDAAPHEIAGVSPVLLAEAGLELAEG